MKKVLSYVMLVVFCTTMLVLPMNASAVTSGTGRATVFGPDVDPGDPQSVITVNNAGGYSASEINSFLNDKSYDGVCAMNSSDLKASNLMGKFIEVTCGSVTKVYKIVDELPDGDNGNNTTHAIDIYLDSTFYALTGLHNAIAQISWKVVPGPTGTNVTTPKPASTPVRVNTPVRTVTPGPTVNNFNHVSSTTSVKQNNSTPRPTTTRNSTSAPKRAKNKRNNKGNRYGHTTTTTISTAKPKTTVSPIPTSKLNNIVTPKSNPTITPTKAPVTPTQVTPANDTAKHTIQQLTSIFENSTPTLQYTYIENIGDGRGYTFGFPGFCSGTYDGTMFLKEYQNLNSSNKLISFIPAFEKIDNMSHPNGMTSNTTGLEQFPSAFKSCGSDPAFVQAQNNVVDRLYWNPSQVAVNEIGAKYAITKGELYDAFINHGEDGARDMINKTNSAVGGTPKSGVDEKTWLSKYLSIRLAVLQGDATWQSAVDRVHVYQTLLNQNNVNLQTPISVSCYGDSFSIK